VRRSGIALVGVALLAAGACGSADAPQAPSCDPRRDVLILIAQSVPGATHLPCIDELPAGWTFEGQQIQRGATTFWLTSTIAGARAVRVDLEPRCNVAGAVPVPSTATDELALERFDKPLSVRPLDLVRYYRFPGGCIVYRYAFAAGAPASLQFEADEALSFIPRMEVVDAVRDFGFELCGPGAGCTG
jgi:hypothetical protein